jgi:hypothetical protein
MVESERKFVKKSSRQNKPLKMEKLEMIIDELKKLAQSGFTGYVKVNYSQGSIGRVEKFEEILKRPK